MSKYKVGEIVLITTSKNLQDVGLPALFTGKIIKFIEANIVSIEPKEIPTGIEIAGLDTFVCGKCATKLDKLYLVRLFENLDYDKLKNLQLTCMHEYELERMLVHNELYDLVTTILEHCQQ